MQATTISGHWKSLPEQARGFLIETPIDSLTLHSFARFWSSPLVIGYALSYRPAAIVRDASISMALNYLYTGKVKESRALMLNGAFMLDCVDSDIKNIAQWCRDNPNVPCMLELKNFNHAFYSVITPALMETFLEKKIRMLHNSSRKQVANFIGHSMKCHQRPTSKICVGAQIQLILVDKASLEERHNLSIGSSATLKTIFIDYAEKRGISLRSVRFSYDGKTLFLSSVSHRTPDDLNMKDQDIIYVQDTSSICQETRRVCSKNKKKPTLEKYTKKRKNCREKPKGKRKPLEHSKEKGIMLSLEDCKARHSRILSALHQEAYPLLKEIRTRLNALELERQPPKQRRNDGKEKKAKRNAEYEINLPNSGVGGKVGKPYFMVQVGEVENLYKTTKSQRHNSSKALALDLHGCTRDEALAKLDGSLAVWVDVAMRGLHPFVIQAKIICGCGNQIISETVEKWIRGNAQVANSRRGSFQ
mmetsp:Transcript_24702/g.53529  ORF Transcript_24702/g.53529 Transcript_24702/m.53529 type:complete len:475 (+) Transcript_24702:212-1636(+)